MPSYYKGLFLSIITSLFFVGGLLGYNYLFSKIDASASYIKVSQAISMCVEMRDYQLKQIVPGTEKQKEEDVLNDYDKCVRDAHNRYPMQAAFNYHYGAGQNRNMHFTEDIRVEQNSKQALIFILSLLSSQSH